MANEERIKSIAEAVMNKLHEGEGVVVLMFTQDDVSKNNMQWFANVPPDGVKKIVRKWYELLHPERMN